jgi:hypothetical protein
VFLVISVYFNIRNTLPKSDTFLLGHPVYIYIYIYIYEGKGKAIPLQAWSSPEGSRKLKVPDFMTTAQDGGKVVSLTHRPPLPPGNSRGTRFC